MIDLRVRIDRAAKTDEDYLRRSRELIIRGLDLLNQNPKPDTFLGRTTQEPFPKQADE